MAGPDDPLVVLVTFPSDEVAAEVCRALVGERHAACANLVPGIRSVYSWEGAVQDDAEVLALVKSTRAALPALEARIAALHPYDTPEVVALEPAHVEARYLAWLRASVGPDAREDAS
ncbi:MAG: divalent-cation tolerance protein CutA [Planctomycetota bacterium]|nr:divalent-cation tolerance protein CutA [Planctomycetota bacterium]